MLYIFSSHYISRILFTPTHITLYTYVIRFYSNFRRDGQQESIDYRATCLLEQVRHSRIIPTRLTWQITAA